VRRPQPKAAMDANATVPGDTAVNYSFAVWNLVIRPPRALYHTWQLGPNEFTVNGIRAVRRDFKLQGSRDGFLHCSHYFPRRDWETEPLRKYPVVVYLHGNSSNRLEAATLLGPLLQEGVSLFCFDSAGCGHSDGDYVSLGWHERDDLAIVLEHLRKSPFCGPIGLWGRSMGAVTVLLHADRDQTIGAICLDSPFVTLRQLIEDLASSVHTMCPLPYWLVMATFQLIRMRVKALANFDVEDVMPLEHAKRSYVPAIFMHGGKDTFISPKHSRQIYDAYLGDKEYVTIDGDHNSERSDRDINRSVDFFRRAFRLDQIDLGVIPHDIFPGISGGTDRYGNIFRQMSSTGISQLPLPESPSPPLAQPLAQIDPPAPPQTMNDCTDASSVKVYLSHDQLDVTEETMLRMRTVENEDERVPSSCHQLPNPECASALHLPKGGIAGMSCMARRGAARGGG